MSICIAIAVPDGIALSVDSQTTWMKTISHVNEKSSGKLIELEQPIIMPISWSKMARKMFSIEFSGITYAFCVAGLALLNQKTMLSIFSSLRSKYNGDGSFDEVVNFIKEGLKDEMMIHLNIVDLKSALVVLDIEFIISSHVDNNISKPRIESWLIHSGKINLANGILLDKGEYKKWTNLEDSKYNLGGTWIGMTDYISHIVAHQNPTLPQIQGQYELLSLSDAVDYTNFLVNFTCDFQRFAITVPNCGKPIISATLRPGAYSEKIID
jgi:hypothetical protein